MTVAGVSIHPVAFLVIQDNTVKLMRVEHDSYVDKLLDYVPDLFQKVNDMINKSMNQKDAKTKKIIEKMQNPSTNKPKSEEVKIQDEKIEENKEQVECEDLLNSIESDGEVFGE